MMNATSFLPTRGTRIGLAGFEDSDSSSDFLRASDDESFHTPRRTSNSPRPPRPTSFSPTIRTREDSEEEDMVEGSPDANATSDASMNAQISAINGMMTTAPVSLVPESSDWQVVESPNQDQEHDWENIDAPQQSSFANNLTARGALGHMAMSVGATSSWNNSILFPDNESNHSGEEQEGTTRAITSSVEVMSSVNRWNKVAHISSVDGLAKLDDYGSDNKSDDSSELVYGEDDKAFGRHVVGPLDSGSIIIANGNGAVGKKLKET